MAYANPPSDLVAEVYGRVGSFRRVHKGCIMMNIGAVGLGRGSRPSMLTCRNWLFGVHRA